MSPGSALVLGGARSGKSALAERLAISSGLAKIYVATGEAQDEEMRERIARHRSDRAEMGWYTIEEPLGLADLIQHEARADRVLLIDCLTLWLSNVILAGRDASCCRIDLLSALEHAMGPVIFVSNEVGLGIVPDNALARAFRDEQGRLNQAVAGLVSNVIFTAAGLPLVLKGSLP